MALPFARTIGGTLNRVWARTLHLSRPAFGSDARDKRAGHLKKTDKVEGEYGSYAASSSSFELIDENLFNRVIDNARFEDIPVVLIKCTRNNTKIILRRGQSGSNEIIALKSCGTEGYKHCRKGTTVAAQAVANRIITLINDYNIDKIRLMFDGLGPGRDAAYKVIELSGIRVVSLSDRTDAVEPWVKRPRAAKSI